MNRMRFPLLTNFLALSISIATTSALATESFDNPSITIYTEEFPPYNYFAKGQVVGINTEVVKQTCEKSNIDCEIVLLPWARAMKNTKANKNSGLYTTSRTPEREEQFKWVGPLVYSVSCFYKLKKRNEIVINSVDDLKKFTIGLMRLDIYQLVLNDLGLREGMNYLTFAQKHQEMELFKKGKIDLIIGSSVTLGAQLKKVGLTLTDVEPTYVLEHSSLKGNFLALNKNISDATVENLQRSLNDLKHNAQVNSIVRNYIPNKNTTNIELANGLEQCIGNATIFN